MVSTGIWIALVIACLGCIQGEAAETHNKRDIPMFRMGRAVGPRMGRDSEEETQEYDKYPELYPIDFDPDSDSDDKEHNDRAIPYPRVGRSWDKRALAMVRMGRSFENQKRALQMVRMGRALAMMRMGRSYSGNDDIKRALNMVRMGRGLEAEKKSTSDNDQKRALKMFRMGKRAE